MPIKDAGRRSEAARRAAQIGNAKRRPEYWQERAAELVASLPPLQRRNPYRSQMVEVAVGMRKSGATFTEIGEALGVGTATANKYVLDQTGEKARASNARRRRQNLGISARDEAERRMNYMDLPLSTKITMRPVWRRRQLRIFGENGSLPPITDEEKSDAIKILGDKRLQRYAPALYFEAFLIFDETSR